MFFSQCHCDNVVSSNCWFVNTRKCSISIINNISLNCIPFSINCRNLNLSSTCHFFLLHSNQLSFVVSDFNNKFSWNQNFSFYNSFSSNSTFSCNWRSQFDLFSFHIGVVGFPISEIRNVCHVGELVWSCHHIFCIKNLRNLHVFFCLVHSHLSIRQIIINKVSWKVHLSRKQSFSQSTNGFSVLPVVCKVLDVILWNFASNPL